MKYDHAIKHQGKRYQPGEDVPLTPEEEAAEKERISEASVERSNFLHRCKETKIINI